VLKVAGVVFVHRSIAVRLAKMAAACNARVRLAVPPSLDRMLSTARGTYTMQSYADAWGQVARVIGAAGGCVPPFLVDHCYD
jgi:hypothetical protein